MTEPNLFTAEDRYQRSVYLTGETSGAMFGDANSWGAFAGPQAVIWGCVLVALGATFGFYMAGMPLWFSLPVFGLVFVGCLAVARPLFEQVEPVFEHEDEP